MNNRHRRVARLKREENARNLKTGGQFDPIKISQSFQRCAKSLGVVLRAFYKASKKRDS